MKLPGTARRIIILDAAIRVANRDGLLRVNWTAVAQECEMRTSERNVRAYYPRYEALWAAVMADPRFTGDKMGYGL